MADIADLTARRARVLAQEFMDAYHRQRDALRLVGVPSADLVHGDDGELMVADVAACMAVATSLPQAGVTVPVLARMRTLDEAAFHVLSKAAEAYAQSGEVRREMGRVAVEPFRRLSEALPATA